MTLIEKLDTLRSFGGPSITRGLPDDEHVGTVGGANEFRARGTLDDERGDRDRGSDALDRDVEFVAGRRGQAELVDAEAALGGEQRHHRRYVEDRHGHQLRTAGSGVLRRPPQRIDRGLRAVDPNDPSRRHGHEYRRPVHRWPVPDDLLLFSQMLRSTNDPGKE